MLFPERAAYLSSACLSSTHHPEPTRTAAVPQYSSWRQLSISSGGAGQDNQRKDAMSEIFAFFLCHMDGCADAQVIQHVGQLGSTSDHSLTTKTACNSEADGKVMPHCSITLLSILQE